MDLIIVESPTKAKTLSRFLGSEYEVEATQGHIKDLPKSKLGVDVENNFEPLYEVVAKKLPIISKIRTSAKKAKNIYLASDPDREGEAIASHVKEVIANTKSKRIVFHEITKEAVEDAIKNPHDVDENLVSAQVARRVLDRLVGYKLSPLLWRKVRIGLSAGRVQTVAVRLIVEKEREIEKFKSKEYWEIYCQLKSKDQKGKADFVVQLAKINSKPANIENSETAGKIVSDLEKADYKVGDIRQKEVRKNPYPPFITSTMQQAGARIFGWSAKKTMSIAQKLYEEGIITYHRTDSVNLSSSAVGKVRDFIESEYGKSYLPDSPRFYKKQSKSAQEAHEAIRPTDISRVIDNLPIVEDKYGTDNKKLYDLIWKRFVACQMNPCINNETAIDISATIEESHYLLRVSGQVVKFDGWRKVMPAKLDVDAVVLLPVVEKDEALQLIKVDPQQKFTQPPARFNEASLIKTLEKLGIGRPSTYAPIISTIQIRNYVEKNESKAFAPTAIGVAVNDFLIKYFPDVFEYSFTAEMENNLDKIAEGKLVWQKSLKSFWGPFDKKLKTVTKESERVKIETEKLNKPCPECKEGELVIRTGRFGKFISCSRFPDCKYTEKLIQKIDVKCPDCKEGDIVIKKTKKGRKFFGCSRYPDCKFASWKKP